MYKVKSLFVAAIALFVLSGCKYLPVRTEVIRQRVEVPVPIACPTTSVEPRVDLPSTLLDQEEPNRDLKGCIMNQAYLLHRVEYLEDILKVYQTQTQETKK